MSTYKITFTNCPPFYIGTLQGEPQAIRTAISQSIAYLKVNQKLKLTFNQQRKNIVNSVLA
jgi:hypothetical protein